MKTISNKIDLLNQSIAAEIRAELGRQSDKSVAELARVIGMRRSTLSSYINGHTKMSPALLLIASRYLEVSTQELFNRAEIHMPELQKTA